MAFQPTPQQEEILEHDPTTDGVVLAGPGTGKSATIVAFIEQLATAQVKTKVRLLTFTRAATAELALKVSEHPTIAAERPSTVHSFAIAVLLRNTGAADYPEPLRMADDWETAEVVRPTLARRASVTAKELKRLLREMEANWQSLTQNDDPKIDAAVRARFLGAWGEHRHVYGYTTLAELPSLLREALVNHIDLKGIDYQLLIVDEYQDLNACDLEVLRRLRTTGCAILAVGDDDQSIYGFRKAAPEGIRRFPEEYRPCSQYGLSIAKRCARDIITWSRFVIEGDPDRPSKAPLTPDDGTPAGETALLGFWDNHEEADGIATLIQQLISGGMAAAQILVMFRGDHNGHFTAPIKQRLAAAGIAISDGDKVRHALMEPANRQSLEVLRLTVDPNDSIAWASLLTMTPGVGPKFIDHIYAKARTARTTFGAALHTERTNGFVGAPLTSAKRAEGAMATILAWLKKTALPSAPDEGWGHWLIRLPAEPPLFPGFTSELADIIQQLDDLDDTPEELARFLNQIAPLGTDLAAAQSDGVRFMTMMASKGLTVQAAIVGAVEEGIVPRPEADLAEERRLLYVAMTRSRANLFLTWARKRTGPTAFSGAGASGLRNPSHFLRHGPVPSQDGAVYIASRTK